MNRVGYTPGAVRAASLQQKTYCPDRLRNALETHRASSGTPAYEQKWQKAKGAQTISREKNGLGPGDYINNMEQT